METVKSGIDFIMRPNTNKVGNTWVQLENGDRISVPDAMAKDGNIIAYSKHKEGEEYELENGEKRKYAGDHNKYAGTKTLIREARIRQIAGADDF